MSFLRDYWPFIAVAAGGTALIVKTTSKPVNAPKKAGPKVIRSPGHLPTTALTAYLSDVFFKEIDALALYAQSRGATVDGDDWMKVFLAESDCKAKVPNSIGCLGLNQICPTKAGDPLSGLRAVGFQGSREEYLALPEEKQLVFVRKFYDNTNGGKSYPLLRDVGSLYLCNFSPAFLGKPDNFVMYRDNGKKCGEAGASPYACNAGVDTGRKGFIEVADMAKFVERSVAGRRAKFDEMRSRLAAAQGIA
jgi:hypothetical protein